MPLIVLLSVLVVSLFADQLPFNLKYKTSKQMGQVKEQSYDRMETVVLEEGKKIGMVVYGQSWKLDFSIPKALRSKQTRDEVKRYILDQVNYKGEIGDDRQRFFQILHDESIYWIYLNIIYNRYGVTVLRETGYEPILHLNASQPYPYSDRLKRLKWSIPSHELIPSINDFVITLASHKRLDRHTFTWQQDGERRSKTVKGKVWHLKYQSTLMQRGILRRYRLMHNYRDLIELDGGIVKHETRNHFIFTMERDGHRIWGEFGCSDIAAELYIVQVDTPNASDLISAEGLKQQLDKTGKAILSGIFFDSGKSKLKSQSQRSVLAASVLMKRYPDIQIEVHGHTDSTGTSAFNQRLSIARARAVQEGLIISGVEKNRIKVKGFGNSRPLVKEKSEKARSQNRRVELHRIKGGNKSVKIDATFFQPLRDAKPVDLKQRPYDTFRYRYLPPYISKKRERDISGASSQVRYILLKDGKRDRSVSAFEIMTVFERIIGAFGGKITAKVDDTFDFKIRKGAGMLDVYGRLEAYTGAYRITTVAAEKVVDPHAKKKKSKKKPN